MSFLLGNTLYLLVKVGLFDVHKWKFQNMKGGADTGVCLAGNLWFTMATVTCMPKTIKPCQRSCQKSIEKFVVGQRLAVITLLLLTILYYYGTDLEEMVKYVWQKI